MLQARLDNLPSSQRHALQLASVIGTFFWSETLAFVETGADEHLQPLERRELVCARAAGPTVAGLREYAFQHQLLHQVTYDTVLKNVKRKAHARTGEWLAQRSLTFGKSLLASAAEHYDNAGDRANAVELYAQAAEHMQAIFANDVAIKCVTCALALIGSEMPDALALRWRLLFTRTRVYELLGRRDEQLADIEMLQDLVTALPANDVRRAEVAWLRGEFAMRTGDMTTAECELRRAMTQGEEAGDQKLSLRALCYLVITLSRTGRFDEGVRLGEAGLARARALGDAGTQAMMHLAMGVLAEQRGDFAANLREMLESLRLCRQTMNVRRTALNLHNIGVVYLKLGELSLARTYLAEALEQDRAHGARESEGRCLLNLAVISWREGDFSLALDQAREAVGILNAVHSREGAMWAEATAGWAALSLGNPGDASAAFERSEALARELGNVPGLLDALCSRAEVAMAYGELPQALQLAERAIEQADAMEVHDLDGRLNRFAGSSEHQNRLTLYRIWHAAGDPRAQPMLAEAHLMILAEADRITEPGLRQSFLELAEPREILALWARHP